MTFIIILISLVLERFFHWSYLRNWQWFSYYQRRLSLSKVANWSSYLLILICILPPVLLVGLVNWLLSGWLYDVFKLIFGVLVLLYCLGPKNLWVQVYACLGELNREDPAAAIAQVDTAFGIGHPENGQAFHRAFTRAIFIAAHQRVFGVLFWFVLLGPAGAVFYRLVTLLSTESALGLTQMAIKLQRLLDWVPVRLFTFVFALGGHFTKVFACWKKSIKKKPAENDAVLSECGIAALDVTQDDQMPMDGSAEKETIALLDRVFVMSLVILAAIVLFFV